jgi:hypothetical protein
VARQRGDAAYVGINGWLAWRVAGHALLSAQDEEVAISGRVLDDGIGVGRGLVECLDGKDTSGMRIRGYHLQERLSRSPSPYHRDLTSDDDAGTPCSLPGRHSAFFAFFSTLPFALFDMVDIRSNAPFEYPCIVSQLTRSAALFE